jgi:Gamma tubulin complex component C-terminal
MVSSVMMRVMVVIVELQARERSMCVTVTDSDSKQCTRIGWDVFTLEYKVDAPLDTVLDTDVLGGLSGLLIGKVV